MVVNIKSKKKFHVFLIYGIVPNQCSRSLTFYFSRANTEEARGVSRCISLFLEIILNFNQLFFSPEALMLALIGH